MRLDKYLSKSLGISRRDAKKLVLSGRVRVNGKVQKDPGFKVEEDTVDLDRIAVERPKENIYIMLNKPVGYISTTKGESPTVLKLVDHPRVDELFPVGRLDKDARGLIILTNDGEFSHKVTSPKSHIEKEYEVVVEGNAGNSLKLLEGVKLNDGHFAKALKVEISGNRINIVIDEGKYHQIKRMMAAVGLKVVELRRTRIGNLRLDIPEGSWRELSEDEIEKVINKR